MTKKVLTQYLGALAANCKGEIFEMEGFAAVGMANGDLTPLTYENTQLLPHGSELMLLPNRTPIFYNLENGEFEAWPNNPYDPDEAIYPVAAFNSPGVLVSMISGHGEDYFEDELPLPLFSYGAVGAYGEIYRSAVLTVDREKRQDLRCMKIEAVQKGVTEIQAKMPQNRLFKHLQKCALEYGCPAGKNFFLGRFEAPLPTSVTCNARCLGCISMQAEESCIHHSQDRIMFTPTPEEIAEIALTHIKRVTQSVVSFGQGCEGEPLTAFKVIELAIKMIRAATDEGTVHLNSNASLPKVLDQLFDAGLDSLRVSINSLREPCYNAYFRPIGYTFADVMASIRLALDRGKFVSLNYFSLAGFTDAEKEHAALLQFLDDYPVHMIQWRNLNFDPRLYWDIMDKAEFGGRPLGMQTVLDNVRAKCPDMLFGYFNPPKEKTARLVSKCNG